MANFNAANMMKLKTLTVSSSFKKSFGLSNSKSVIPLTRKIFPPENFTIYARNSVETPFTKNKDQIILVSFQIFLQKVKTAVNCMCMENIDALSSSDTTK